jgi:hypothetical protein
VAPHGRERTRESPSHDPKLDPTSREHIASKHQLKLEQRRYHVTLRFTLRRAVTALALGAATAATLAMTAPAAVADPGTAKQQLMRLRDACDKPTWDTTAGFAGLCTVEAGGVKPQEFLDAIPGGGSGAWWINNRNETINGGDSLVVDNEGGELHSFTEVDRFGQGIVPTFNAAVPNDPPLAELGGESANFPTTFVAPNADNPFGAPDSRIVSGLSVGTHRFQCVIHPCMRTTVTVRPAS